MLETLFSPSFTLELKKYVLRLKVISHLCFSKFILLSLLFGVSKQSKADFGNYNVDDLVIGNRLISIDKSLTLHSREFVKSESFTFSLARFQNEFFLDFKLRKASKYVKGESTEIKKFDFIVNKRNTNSCTKAFTSINNGGGIASSFYLTSLKNQSMCMECRKIIQDKYTYSKL